MPWCVRKCPYCDFNSHERRDNFDEERYVDALLKDFQSEYELAGERQIETIFFGGGTPSLFSAGSLHRLLAGIADQAPLAEDIEITLEANPGTFEQERFSAYRETGINRLSIGIQSFDDTQLENLGRIHNSDEAHAAIETATTAGFDNINLDLMFALPGQDIEQAVADIRTACETNVNHISFYQLTIEANTWFHKYPPVLPDSDKSWEMQENCYSLLNEYGYQQYEVSAFSKPGKQSRHNINYWLFGDYIGIGAGAHGKLSNINTGITRRWKKKQPADYMSHALTGSAISNSAVIKPEELVFEFLMNALRLKNGFDKTLFEQRTGLPMQELENVLRKVDDSLLDINENTIRTSDTGYVFLNHILEKLL